MRQRLRHWRVRYPDEWSPGSLGGNGARRAELGARLRRKREAVVMSMMLMDGIKAFVKERVSFRRCCAGKNGRRWKHGESGLVFIGISYAYILRTTTIFLGFSMSLFPPVVWADPGERRLRNTPHRVNTRFAWGDHSSLLFHTLKDQRAAFGTGTSSCVSSSPYGRNVFGAIFPHLTLTYP